MKYKQHDELINQRFSLVPTGYTIYDPDINSLTHMKKTPNVKDN